jgi:hypothetical protein
MDFPKKSPFSTVFDVFNGVFRIDYGGKQLGRGASEIPRNSVENRGKQPKNKKIR